MISVIGFVGAVLFSILHIAINIAYENCAVLVITQSVVVRSRVQKFPASHTKAAPNGKCCEGYIVPSMVRLRYRLKSVLK